MNKRPSGHYARPVISDAKEEKLVEAARMIEVALRRGNFDQARTIVDEAEREFLRPPERVLPESSIYEIGLNPRVANALFDEIGVKTVADACSLKRERFIATPNLGGKHWKDLGKCLAKHGFERED